MSPATAPPACRGMIESGLFAAVHESGIGGFCCKSRHTDGAGRLMPFVEAVRCHPLDCAGRLTLDFTDACNVTQTTQGRVVVAGRPTWQACEGSAQSLPT